MYLYDKLRYCSLFKTSNVSKAQAFVVHSKNAVQAQDIELNQATKKIENLFYKQPNSRDLQNKRQSIIFSKDL